ncbi:MAG TPA: hypothetical protein VK879_00525 [Candidatus Sulfomarinibacteraceae bacterium]|nr:hypothetical protein [Candidatus Sulfomarinibacteraceae bacterium]
MPLQNRVTPYGEIIATPARGETAYLLPEGALWPWSPAGYGEPLSLPRGERMTVLTPRSTVGALRVGYRVAGLQV